MIQLKKFSYIAFFLIGLIILASSALANQRDYLQCLHQSQHVVRGLPRSQ